MLTQINSIGVHNLLEELAFKNQIIQPTSFKKTTFKKHQSTIPQIYLTNIKKDW